MCQLPPPFTAWLENPQQIFKVKIKVKIKQRVELPIQLTQLRSQVDEQT